MIDPQILRTDPDRIRESQRRRGEDITVVDRLIEADSAKRAAQTQFDELRNQQKLIGNGSVVDVQFSVRDYGPGKKRGVYPRVIRVLDHVPYEGSGGLSAVSEEDEYYQKALAAQEAALARMNAPTIFAGRFRAFRII